MYNGLKTLLRLIGLILAFWLSARILLPFFLPLLLGGLIALAAEPMSGFLQGKCRLPRTAASGFGVSATLVFLMLVLIVSLALLLREAGALVAILPDLEQAASSGLSTLSQWVFSRIARLPSGIQGIARRGAEDLFSGGSQLLQQALRYAVSITGGFLTSVPNGALVLFTSLIAGYMISARLPGIRKRIRNAIPRERLEKLLGSLRRIRRALGCWLKAQLKLMGITWVILLLGLVLLRIPHAPVWAAAVALVDAFPILGTGTVLLPWSAICFLQGDSPRALGLLGIYGVVTLGRSVLEPKILGSQLGLDPLLTLTALYAGYRLWGLAGMIFAPVLAVAAMQILHPSETEM